MIPFLMKAPPTPRDRDHTLRQAVMVPLAEDAAEFTARFGVDTDKLRQALQMSSAANHALDNWGNQTMAWAEDDMKIVQDMAAEAGIGLPQSALNREVCRVLKPRRYRLGEYGL